MDGSAGCLVAESVGDIGAQLGQCQGLSARGTLRLPRRFRHAKARHVARLRHIAWVNCLSPSQLWEQRVVITGVIKLPVPRICGARLLRHLQYRLAQFAFASAQEADWLRQKREEDEEVSCRRVRIFWHALRTSCLVNTFSGTQSWG